MTHSPATIRMPSTRVRRLAAAAAAALLLAACGGDEASDAVADSPEELVEDAEELADDAEEIAEDAQEQLDDAGVDTEAGGYAEVVFQGETLRLEADEQFGCFITADGGSDGAVNFSGRDEAGNEVSLGWAGDTPELSTGVRLTLADGSDWTTPAGAGGDLQVTISGSRSAVVSGTLVALDGSSDEADVVVRPICG